MNEPSISDVMRAKDMMDNQSMPDKGLFYYEGSLYVFGEDTIEIHPDSLGDDHPICQ